MICLVVLSVFFFFNSVTSTSNTNDSFIPQSNTQLNTKVFYLLTVFISERQTIPESPSILPDYTYHEQSFYFNDTDVGLTVGFNSTDSGVQVLSTSAPSCESNYCYCILHWQLKHTSVPSKPITISLQTHKLSSITLEYKSGLFTSYPKVSVDTNGATLDDFGLYMTSPRSMNCMSLQLPEVNTVSYSAGCNGFGYDANQCIFDSKMLQKETKVVYFTSPSLYSLYMLPDQVIFLGVSYGVRSIILPRISIRYHTALIHYLTALPTGVFNASSFLCLCSDMWLKEWFDHNPMRSLQYYDGTGNGLGFDVVDLNCTNEGYSNMTFGDFLNSTVCCHRDVRPVVDPCDSCKTEPQIPDHLYDFSVSDIPQCPSSSSRTIPTSMVIAIFASVVMIVLI